MRLIILAAGQGTRLKPITNEKPKCLTSVNNKSILQWQIDTAHRSGITEIIVVGGYKIEQLRTYPVTVIENPLYASTNMVYSLYCAREYLNEPFILSYGDIIYDDVILQSLLKSPHDISVTIDKDWQEYWQSRFEDPLIDAESLSYSKDLRLTNIGQKVNSLSEIQGQYIGLCYFQKQGLIHLQHCLDRLYKQQDQDFTHAKMFMTDLLQKMVDTNIPVKIFPIHRGWYEIDNLNDLAIAEYELSLHSSSSLAITS